MVECRLERVAFYPRGARHESGRTRIGDALPPDVCKNSLLRHRRSSCGAAVRLRPTTSATAGTTTCLRVKRPEDALRARPPPPRIVSERHLDIAAPASQSTLLLVPRPRVQFQ